MCKLCMQKTQMRNQKIQIGGYTMFVDFPGGMAHSEKILSWLSWVLSMYTVAQTHHQAP